jgi:hypothetical protein
MTTAAGKLGCVLEIFIGPIAWRQCGLAQRERACLVQHDVIDCGETFKRIA